MRHDTRAPTPNGHRTDRAALDRAGVPTHAAKQRLKRWAETTRLVELLPSVTSGPPPYVATAVSE
jgi:hypothetical protein